MKKHLLLTTLLCSTLAHASAPTLTLKWEGQGLRTPESVLPYSDANSSFLWVSEIEGDGNEADGKGGIAKLGLDGKILEPNWLRGLNAPKGMGVFQGKLYVADMTEVVEIDIAKKAILQKIPVADAVFLNDITIDPTGIIYVSDTRTNKVHRIQNNKVELYLSDINAANGLTFADDHLYVAGGDTLWQVDSAQKITKIAQGFAENADGLEKIGADEFIVSCWAGITYYVKNGELTTLLDTRTDKKNTADIGWNASTKTLYIPTFNSHSVTAYTLK